MTEPSLSLRVLKELGVDFRRAGPEVPPGVCSRPLLNPAPVNASLVLAPTVAPSASMDVVLRGREGEAKCLDPLVFGLIFFPFSFLISSLTKCWRGAWGSRRSVGVTGGKGARLARRDARYSCAVIL